MNNFINPNDLFSSDVAYPFIYTKNHELNLGGPNQTHYQISKRSLDYNSGLFGRIADNYTPGPVNQGYHADYESIVSFWTTDKDTYDSLLKSCIRTLLVKNLISEDTYVTSMFHKTPVQVKNLTYKNNDVHQTEIDRVKKLRNLHLMGVEKNQALKDRGVIPKTPVGAAMGLQPGQKHWSMYGDHNLNFISWYENINIRSISPDDLYASNGVFYRDSVPFIYMHDNNLIIGQQGDTHGDSVITFDFRKKYPDIYSPSQLITTDLMGRIAWHYQTDPAVHGVKKNYENIVSFWNVDKELYDEMLKPCLKALLNKNYISEETYLTSPVHPKVTQVKAILSPSASKIKPIDKATKDDIRLLQQLHLMGMEKNQALKDRGVKPKIGPRIPVIGDHREYPCI